MIGFKEFDSSLTTVPIKEVVYVYDPMGRRVLKEIVDHVNTAKSYSRAYVYHNQEIIEEYDGAQNLLAQYGHSYLRTDDPLTMKTTSAGVSAGLSPSASTYSFLKDAQGTITEVANSSGTVVQRNFYNSFGKILSLRDSSDADVTATPVIKTPFAFTGREFDEESGHYYYRARFYDPNTGRFLQKDPSPGKTTTPQTVVNAYAYGINNPWNFMDPNGRSIFDFVVGIVIGIAAAFTGGLAGAALGAALGGGVGGGIAGLIGGAIVGALTGATIGGISNILRGRDFGDNLLEYALAGAIAGGVAGAVAGYNVPPVNGGVQTVSQATKSFMQNFNWNPITRFAAQMSCFDQARAFCPFAVPNCWQAIKCIFRGAEAISDPNTPPTNTNTNTNTSTDTDSAFYGNWGNNFV